ncbi:MAG: biotin-dependent carboxyltransferase family protein [Lawsonibacter sp.]
MGLQVISPGPLTSVQDEGRFGHQRIGMSPAGAMDLHSMRLANLLVDNCLGEAVLEMTFLGAKLQFTQDNVFALTGADMGATLDGVPVPLGQAWPAKAGSVLQLGSARTGCRGYLAIAGGLDVPLLYGSKSTLLRSSLGGFQGRKLAAGDLIPFAAPRSTLPNLAIRRLPPQPPISRSVTVRVILGPQEDRFTKEGLDTFFNSTFSVSEKSDRMGYRLTGPKVEHSTDANIISDGIPLGAVQIPGSGEPIIMMSEHQGSGGYTKIANVISVDIPLVAQCPPGASIRFQAVTVEQAQALYLAQQAQYEQLRQVYAQNFHSIYQVRVNGHTYCVGVAAGQ